MKSKLHSVAMALLALLFTASIQKVEAFIPEDSNLLTENCETNIHPEINSFEALIRGFMLVDATTNLDIKELLHNDIIYVDVAENRLFNIAVIPTANIGEADYVNMEISGPINSTRNEFFAPHALFGDFSGDYSGRVFPLGNYTITATPFSTEKGQLDSPTVIPFSVRDISELTIDSLEFVYGNGFEDTIEDDCTSAACVPLNDGDYIDRSGAYPYDGSVAPFLGFSASIVARTASSPGSVRFNLSGPISSSRTENIAPYSLFGDFDGILNLRFFPEGAYTLTVTPYSESNGQGLQGTALSISFVIVEASVTLQWGYTVVDSDTNLDHSILTPFVSPPTLNKSESPENVNFTVALLTGATDRVDFVLEGPLTHSRTELVPPFALFGDIGGNYFGRNMPVGNYTLTATPFSSTEPDFKQRIPLVVSFEVVDDVTMAAQPSKEVILFPNPADDITSIISHDAGAIHETALFNIYGQKVKEFNAYGNSKRSLDVSELPRGLYFVRISNQKEVIIKRLLVK